MDNLRLIGDVHGLLTPKMAKKAKVKGSQCYLDVAGGATESIQVGDMAFHYESLNLLDPDKHRFFGGNHDNYDVIKKCPNALGDYGLVKAGGLDFFYARGGFSIDKIGRIYNEATTGRKSWWTEEQLDYSVGVRALHEYKRICPRFMLSHSCPEEVAKLIGNTAVLRNFGFVPEEFSTVTQKMLQAMLEVHEPEVWVFGHFHMDKVVKVRNTTFICMNELQYLNVGRDGSFLNSKGEKLV